MSCLISTKRYRESALLRILQIIQCLAVTSPKNSTTALGSFKDEETRESDEEHVLKKAIDRCVTALFTNTADNITSKLAQKVLTFVKTNQFESQLATDMISSLISQMTYASPRFWLPFAEHVLHNLRSLLTPDAQAAEELETSTQWFVGLAGSLLSTTSENYLEKKDICFEMIGLLVACKNKVAYNNGAIGLWYMLYMLSRIYPENSRYISDRLNRPLSEWVPVREWGTLHDLQQSKMAWYVPGEKGKELVKLLLRKFVFPVVDLLRDEKLDRDTLKKAFFILSYGLSGSITCFPMPCSPVFDSPNTVLPWFKADLANPSVVSWDIPYPSGRNFREELVDVLEKVIERLVTSKREHTQVLSCICRILHNLIETSYTDSHQLDIASGEHSDIYNYLTTPLSRKVQIFVLESQAYVSHMRMVVESPERAFTMFHLRVFHLLARLTLNDYSEVRGEARAVLSTLFSEYAIAKETIVEDILPTLSDPNSTRDQLKGALCMISQSNWATSSTIGTKMKVWKAIIEMKVVDYPEVIDLYDDLWNEIGKMQKPARKHYECKKLNAFCKEWLHELPKSGEWSKFKDPKVLEDTVKMRAARRAANQK
ncbi:unnamed protein product [Strongylus vulgaris]|uniref:Proteasome activator Blm10 middle HEAT repeats region domain-containing protein n=1 Tax=Strongylus vulgaris TaxID=40348 RepID=A0A3P7K9C9_STRVU|nr:unnamed protein product [Strongylus vulgaris]